MYIQRKQDPKTMTICFHGNVYRRDVGISVGAHCAPLIADVFLFYYEPDLMLYLRTETHSSIIQ